MNKKDSFVINLAEMTAGWSLLTGGRVWGWAMADGDIQIVTSGLHNIFCLLGKNSETFKTENIQFELGKLTLST